MVGNMVNKQILVAKIVISIIYLCAFVQSFILASIVGVMGFDSGKSLMAWILLYLWFSTPLFILIALIVGNIKGLKYFLIGFIGPIVTIIVFFLWYIVGLMK